MKNYIFHICIFPIIFYNLALPKYRSSCQGLLQMQIFQFASVAFASQSHKDFDPNENNFINSKAIRVTGK